MTLSKSQKIILYTIGGLAGLLVIIAAGLHFFVDANAYKPRVEAAASDALGMEVRVGGKMGFSLFPGLQVTLQDVQIRNRGTDLVTAKEARLGIELLPLLRKEVRIGKIVLKHPSIYIELGSDGKYNFETKQPSGPLPALGLGNISLTDSSLIYADKQSGGGFEAGDCKLDLRHFLLAQGKSSDLIKNLSFTAELACAKIRAKDITASDLKLSLAVKDGIFDVKPLTMEVFGGQGSGSIRANYSAAVPQYWVDYALQQFRIETFYETLSPQKVVEGPMDFTASLSMQGKTVDEMIKTANGDATLRGENLTFIGSDLDLEFARYESSQHFDLVDVGAVIFAGPVGLAVTKGYDFASILKESGGTSAIRKLVSEWKIEQGVAHAQDVAMATNKNRIALKGGLDFVKGRFDDVTVTLLDAKGCAKVEQKISGPFQKPVVEQPNFLVALAGPALKLLKKGIKLLPGGECKVIYDGSVAPAK
jgi:AsmA protein